MCVPWLELWPKETSKSMLSEATGSIESETESESASGSTHSTATARVCTGGLHSSISNVTIQLPKLK